MTLFLLDDHRYYKQTWKNFKPCNKDLWFRVHQMVMTMVLLSSVAAFVIICIVKGFLPYSVEAYQSNPHPATGKIINLNRINFTKTNIFL